MKQRLAITAIAILALCVRLYGLNWDQGQHLHPDERFLTMVTIALKWPSSLTQYFDTATSPLNPHNVGFSFFVYGTFPLLIVKAIAESLSLSDYINLTLVGRMVSALLDTGTVILVYLIADMLIKRNNIPFLASFFYAISILPIQLSHFYAVDTFVTFFITLSFLLCVHLISDSPAKIKYFINVVILGIGFGLALSSKISAILFLPIIGISLAVMSVNLTLAIKKNIFNFLIVFLLFSFLFFLSSYITVRLAQPYLFTGPAPWDIHLNPKVIDNWNQLKSFDDPNGGFPPGVQWITTKPYLFPLKNLIFWGLGLPLGLLTVGGLVYTLVTWLYGYLVGIKIRIQKLSSHSNHIAMEKKPGSNISLGMLLMLLWILLLFSYQGHQFVKAMRYFYPIYPFLAIISAYFSIRVIFSMQYWFQSQKLKFKTQNHNSKIKSFTAFEFSPVFLPFAFCLLTLLPAAAFLSIYSRPHSRVQASAWIYQNIPPGSTLSSEHWDDALPLTLLNHDPRQYQGMEFTLYYPDSEAKWREMADKLNQVDYIILTSNRLYGSLMTIPAKFPITSRYYQKLFDGSLGFTKVAEFTSRPNLPIPFVHTCLTPPGARYGIVSLPTQECSLPGLTLVDDYADESFTVYDHPKVIIFKKVTPVDYLQVLTY